MMKVFSTGGELELPSKLQWKNARETALMEWATKARNYNTFAANVAFLLSFVVTLVAAIFIFYDEYDVVGSLGRAAFFFVVITAGYTSGTHRKISFAVRITDSGIEFCEWKFFPKWVLVFINCLVGGALVLCVTIASADPKLLVGAFAGVGGIGLMAWLKFNSKSYQDSQTIYHHHELKWADVTRLVIASNRDVVDLKYAEYTDGDPLPRISNVNIFCRRKEKHKIAELLLPMLPKGTPSFTAKVNVPFSIADDYR